MPFFFPDHRHVFRTRSFVGQKVRINDSECNLTALYVHWRCFSSPNFVEYYIRRVILYFERLSLKGIGYVKENLMRYM